MSAKLTPSEQGRLDENAKKAVPLVKWGPYLSERQWGTVREDYSAGGDAWNSVTHDHSRSKAYRWGEDGIGGISDVNQNLNFAVALWNGKDPILKERFFGLTNSEGNHGEDCKELYYFLDNVPTHSYMKMLYKYSQQAYPYEALINVNRGRGKFEPEFELLDTGIFNENQYFDVFITYAKNAEDDILIEIEIVNHYKKAADITVLPTLWFTNRWTCGDMETKPGIELKKDKKAWGTVITSHEKLGKYHFYFDAPNRALFTENETNNERLYGVPDNTSYVKDAFHKVIADGQHKILDGKDDGTKFAPTYILNIKSKASKKIKLRLSKEERDNPFEGFEAVFAQRLKEADEFYEKFAPVDATPDQKNIQRQTFASLLWSKQYFHYDVERWLNGDPGLPAPPESRRQGRNKDWKYLKNEDIISMPDTWEYPWYAAWDLAFHCIPMSMIDPVFAKNQLLLVMREWYMNPAGQIPAYEWNFSDVNPPVHAWSALSVYRIEKTIKGTGDIHFLKRVFQKLLINFTWWVNRKDENDNNIFEGGFLGLDNIGVFNRNEIPKGALLEQVDGTSWMAMYALNMMDIALEIAVVDSSFEDVATKFYEHYVLIAESINEAKLWDEEDGFFYDLLTMPSGEGIPLKVHSTVGLSVLFAVSIIDYKKIEKLTDFKKRVEYFKNYRLKTGKYLPNEQVKEGGNILISLVKKEKLVRILQRLLDETEFLAQGGIRAVSKYHEKNPYFIHVAGGTYSISYDPGESTSGMFGGNSNWRGPIWMPTNYLLIKALKKYHQYYGESLKLEYPTGSDNWLNLERISDALAKRVVTMFEKDNNDKRPVHRDHAEFYSRPENKDLLLFYEYFHGDTGRGVGATHQTGWTAVVAELINDDAWEWE
ncbi:glucosidase [soil metagenome]